MSVLIFQEILSFIIDVTTFFMKNKCLQTNHLPLIFIEITAGAISFQISKFYDVL